MRKSVLAFLLIVASSYSVCQAAPEPYHIKQDVLGESLSIYRQNNPKDCTSRPDFSKEKSCVTPYEDFKADVALKLNPGLLTYANVPVQTSVVIGYEDRLCLLEYRFDNGNFETLKTALIAKFGDPSSSTVEPVQNRMGATFSSHRLKWVNGVSTIVLDEFHGDLNTTAVTFIHDELFHKMNETQHNNTRSTATKDM